MILNNIFSNRLIIIPMRRSHSAIMPKMNKRNRNTRPAGLERSQRLPSLTLPSIDLVRTGGAEATSKLTGACEASAWLPLNDVSVSLCTGSESTGVGEKKVTPSMEDSRSKLLTGSESTGVGESASALTGVGGSTAWLPPNGLPHSWQNLALSATWVPHSVQKATVDKPYIKPGIGLVYHSRPL